MRKAADLIKKQLVQVDSGNIVGSIADLLIDPEAGRLAAVVTTTGRWRETTLIPWDQIVVSTGDVVLIAAGVEPQPASAVPRLQALLERKIHHSGTPVLTEKGTRVGTVGELLIDSAGAIQAYTINRGFLGSERLFVTVAGVASIGADALLVHEESLQDSMEPTAEGARAEELKHAIVLPLTGTRLLVNNDGVAIETPAEASAHALAEPAPDETKQDNQADPELSLPADFAPAATGATVQLSGAEVDAILRGDQPVPEAAPASPPAAKNPYKLSGAEVDAILRSRSALPVEPAEPAPEQLVQLSGAEVDAGLPGDQPVPAAPAADPPAPEPPAQLSGAEADAGLRGDQPIPEPPSAPADPESAPSETKKE
jgi:uncharacterized protein YrrD